MWLDPPPKYKRALILGMTIRHDGVARIKTQIGGTCGSPDPSLRHDKRQTHDGMLLSCPPSDPGSVGTMAPPQRASVMCVGNGAKGTWVSLAKHGRGLAQGAPGGVVRETKPKLKDDPFPPLLKPTVWESGQSPLVLAAAREDRRDVQAAGGSATRAARSASVAEGRPSRCMVARNERRPCVQRLARNTVQLEC
jgi:hypothetical protein